MWGVLGHVPSRASCVGVRLLLEVLFLLVGPEEGLLLEFRISDTGRMFQALFLLQYLLLLSVLGFRHGALLRLMCGS